MNAVVNLYSSKKGDIFRFLNLFFNNAVVLENELKWEKQYNNPIEMTEIIGAFVDNSNNFSISMWVSLDARVFC